MKKITILTGDCRTTLQSLPDKSVQCCITSPPYFGLRDYGHAGQIGLEQSPNDYVDQIVAVFSDVHRVLVDDGTLWLNLGDSYAAQRGGTAMPAETLAGGVGGKGDETAHRGHGSIHAHRNASRIGLKHKDLIGIPWRVAFALQSAGWYLRQDIIWHKPNPMPESVTDRCTKAHEYIFLLSKSEKYYFNSTAMQEPAVCKNKRGSALHPDTESTNGNAGLAQREITGMRNRRSVWTVTTKPFKGAHFATFPPDLIEPCVLAGCPENGTVLDPFGGAGTTGLVAQQHGRRAILCELNPKYVEMTEQRLGLSADQQEDWS